MAKRKSKRKGRVGARRRMSGVLPKRYENDTYMAVGVLAGLLAARMVPAVIAKVAPGMNPKIVNGLQSIVGIFGAVTTAKYPLLRGASLGVAGMGFMDLVTNMGWLPSPNAVGADEVLFNLDAPMSGAGNGYPTSLMAGSAVGASYNNQFYANNVMAGIGVY